MDDITPLISALHKNGYVHGDLKPANILYCKQCDISKESKESEENYCYKVTDFSIINITSFNMYEITVTPMYTIPFLLYKKYAAGIIKNIHDDNRNKSELDLLKEIGNEMNKTYNNMSEYIMDVINYYFYNNDEKNLLDNNIYKLLYNCVIV